MLFIQFTKKLMKTIYLSLALVLSITAVQADLVMDLNWGSPMIKVTTKIKRDKILFDIYVNENKGGSLIADLKTGDYFDIQHWSKKIIKNSLIPTNYTNDFEKTASPKFQDIGKTEMLNGYEAEIYEWKNLDGITEKLWVAKNYPNFEVIKKDLEKLDKFNDKKWILNFGSLSGMPLKLLIPDKDGNAQGRGLTFTLLSAKEEPIDDSVFELPKDYHFNGTNAPVASTNEVISTTNTPTVK
jgi:hypothetical protein